MLASLFGEAFGYFNGFLGAPSLELVLPVVDWLSLPGTIEYDPRKDSFWNTQTDQEVFDLSPYWSTVNIEYLPTDLTGDPQILTLLGVLNPGDRAIMIRGEDLPKFSSGAYFRVLLDTTQYVVSLVRGFPLDSNPVYGIVVLERSV